MNKFLLIASGVFLATGLFAVSSGASRPAETVEVEQARALSAADAKKCIGKMAADFDINLFARVSGLILEQKFKHGDLVTKGQLLFVLEDTTYRAKADSARAALKQSEAELQYAQSNLRRHITLRDQKAVAESSYEEAIRLNAINEAKVAANRAALTDAENELSYTRIYSPITGRAGKATFSPFNLVTPSSGTLVNLVSLDPVNIDFPISERDFLSMFGDIDAIKKYADVRVELADGSLYNLPGRISFVDNKVDVDTDTITVRAVFRNPDYKLIPGGLTTIRLARKVSGTFAAVRPSAVMIDDKGAYVYVLDADNTVHLRRVTLGVLENNWQTVKSGLKPGETVVIDGTHKAMPGGKVNPVRAAGETK